jgi:hypothetical protein
MLTIFDSDLYAKLTAAVGNSLQAGACFQVRLISSYIFFSQIDDNRVYAIIISGNIVPLPHQVKQSTGWALTKSSPSTRSTGYRYPW